MRGSLTHRLAILILVLFTMLPAAALPQRSSEEPGFFQRIVRIVRGLLPHSSEELSFPKP